MAYENNRLNRKGKYDCAKGRWFHGAEKVKYLQRSFVFPGKISFNPRVHLHFQPAEPRIFAKWKAPYNGAYEKFRV